MSHNQMDVFKRVRLLFKSIIEHRNSIEVRCSQSVDGSSFTAAQEQLRDGRVCICVYTIRTRHFSLAPLFLLVSGFQSVDCK